MASTPDPKTTSVLIVGCGTWGASTALHLARRGYKNVTVLDPYEVPSRISAGNDINKIVRMKYEDDANQIALTFRHRKGTKISSPPEVAKMRLGSEAMYR